MYILSLHCSCFHEVFSSDRKRSVTFSLDIHPTVRKNKKFSLTKKIFRQFYSLVTYLIYLLTFYYILQVVFTNYF